MKGFMKGVIIVYVKQCIKNGCYIGIIEFGIIGVEVLNLIVNELVIMLDIEKCLEVFICCGYGVIVFLGGVGIVEEIFYLFGILLYLDNVDLLFLVVFIGIRENVEYFEMIDNFICNVLGDEVVSKYEIIIDDLVRVVQIMKKGMKEVEMFWCVMQDVYYFNWMLKIDLVFQLFFYFNYENMWVLELYWD